MADMNMDDINGNSDKRKSVASKVRTFLLNNLLIFFLLLSLVLGIGLGAALRTVHPPLTTRGIIYLRFPGDLLMNMLSFLIVPLIISSLISGLSSLDTRASGKMGLRAVIYYLTTTLAAVVLGIVVSVTIQPGTRGGDPDELLNEDKDRVVNTADTFLDLIRQCFPDNIVEMCFKKTLTEQVLINGSNEKTVEGTDLTTVPMVTTNDVNTTGPKLPENGVRQEPEKVYEPVLVKQDGLNVLGMVVFSVFLGVILGRMGPRGKPLIDLFDCICEATMQLVKLVIWYSPIGIMCLIAAKVVEMDDLGKTFEQLLFYFLTVMTGLVLHGFLTLPLIYFVIVRKNPFSYLYGVLEAVVTALATASSSATMPVTMRCLEDRNGVDNRIIKFVIPVGATINMDGTALYEAVAVLFIGQMRGFDMDIGRIITIRDRFRTAINVLGDAFGAGIVHHLSRDELAKLDENHSVVLAATDGLSGMNTESSPQDTRTSERSNNTSSQRDALLNENTRFKSYSGISNDGFIEKETDT
ncbi:excitatory amino acid transporter 3-like isoform X2 [Mercenaria mercenaria]|uniref:excitatory amino acid transporter 3-like isoform X2 n=1 Tax=Mercenaria mercenaria TaxID=6596 RepID=UPI00234EFB04|nr:excitatory amino acid transporter 3-like isoform X2 [Mercenaria mercenaria]